MVAPVVIGAASIIGRRVAISLGTKALANAFRTAGLRGLLKALGGRIIAAAIIAFSVKAVISWVIQTGIYLYNFNWNMSDRDIDAQLNASINQLAGLAGNAVGQTLGWVTCGAVPGAVLLGINPAAGAIVLERVGEEAVEEVIAAWVGLIRGTVAITTRSFLLWGFKNLRRAIKKNAIAQKIFGPKLQEWGANDGPVISLAKFVEDRIEEIPWEPLRNFVENAWEEFWESCAEAMFVFADALDSFYALQKQTMRENVLGEERIVEITPDRSVPNQKIVLAGNERALMPAIVETITTHQLLDEKDVGQIVGQPLIAAIKKQPLDISIFIQFYNTPHPPLPKDELIEACYQIHNINRAALDWDRIKIAAGGRNGFLYGRERLTYTLDNGTPLTVWGASQAECRQLIEGLLSLSSANVTGKSGGIELEGGNRSTVDGNMKKLVRLYPYSFTVIRAKPTANLSEGRKRVIDGKRVTYKKQRFYLWPETKPVGIDEALAEILT